MKTRIATLALAAAFALSAGSASLAQPYPDQPITLIVPYGAGGGSDLVGRAIGRALERTVDVPVVVQNVTGQGGVVGARAVRDADPDGYTLLVAHAGLQTLFHAGQVDFTYTDLTPIALMVSGTEAIAVNADSPYQTIGDLVKDGMQRPNELRYGASLGGTSHFLAQSLSQETGVQFQIVPYDGEAERATALAGGHIDVVSGGLSSLSGYLDAGNIRLLGIADSQGASNFPDVPTLVDQGVDVQDSFVGRGLYGPAGVPSDVVEFLQEKLAQVAADEEFAADLSNLNYGVHFLTGEDYTAYLEAQDAVIEELAAGM